MTELVVREKLALEEKTFLHHLTSLLDEVIVGRPETYPTAQQVHHELGLYLSAINPMLSLYEQGLSSLSVWLRDQQLPALSGLVVNKTTRRPSDIFFQLFQKNRADITWWHEQIAKAVYLDWQPYLQNVSSKNPFAGQRILILDEPDLYR